MFLISFIMFTACSERTLDVPETVLTEFHLQSGFYGQVTIWVDNDKVYDQVMSSQVPIDGPQNQFTLPMNRGVASIRVSWGESSSQLTDESSVRLGSSEEYFLGINIVDDSIDIRLQSSVFLY